MFSMPDVAVILAVVLVIFGPGKLPQIGESLGKGIRNFKKATDEEALPTEKVEKLEHQAASGDPSETPKS